MAVDRHTCSVLVIEDDAEMRDLIKLALTAEGYRVVAVPNGRAALDHLRCTADTCVLVLDLMLPVMDGLRFRAAQLRDRSLAWIPVIVVSGDADAPRLARDVGARSFVQKPLDIERLTQALRHVGCLRSRPRSQPPLTSAPDVGEEHV
jgi:CheY-like chemotaxis protein